MMKTSCVVMCTLAATLATAVASAADPGSRVIYDGKQPRLYAVDSGHVAICIENVAQRQRVASAHGLQIAKGDGWHTESWSLAALPTQRRTLEDAADIRATLSRDDDVSFVSPVLLDEYGRPMVMTRDILVKIAPGRTAVDLDAVFSDRGEAVEVIEQYTAMPGTYLVRTAEKRGESVLSLAASVAQDDRVVFAHPDRIITIETQGDPAQLFPDEGSFSSLWGLHNVEQSGACHSPGEDDADMDAPEAWAITTGDAAVAILVIDNGVQLDHVDLNIDPALGADFTSQSGGGNPVNQCDNHGTLVAGCAGANWNGFGMVGSAPDCRLASARTFISTTPSCNGSATGQDSWLINALNYTSTIDARIAVSSFTTSASAAISNAYIDTHNAGVVHMVAAGNGGDPVVFYPATLSATLAVGGFTKNGDRSPLSNFGNGLDFLAPSRQIRTTDRMGADGNEGRHYTCVEGTSFAAPYAAGAAALLISINPSITADEVEDALKAGCVDAGPAGFDTGHGHGLLNMYNVLEPFVNPPCQGDCTPPGGNGIINIDDLLAIVNAISTQDLGCDVAPDNGDGTFGNGAVNIDDLLAAVSNFGPCD